MAMAMALRCAGDGDAMAMRWRCAGAGAGDGAAVFLFPFLVSSMVDVCPCSVHAVWPTLACHEVFVEIEAVVVQ
jgi:hypothetical protein